MPYLVINVFLLVVVIAIINIVIFKLIFGKLKKKQQAHIQKVEGEFAGKEIKYGEDFSNFFGQESLGMGQVRGNGILRITDDEIYFSMLMPNKVFRFPIKNITAIETPKSHLGKTKFVPLLKVVFTDEQGEPDSAAWLVKDLSSVKSVLEGCVV